MKRFRCGQRSISPAAPALVVLFFVSAACQSLGADASPTPQGGSSWRDLFDDGQAEVGRFVMGFAEDDLPTGQQVGTQTYSVPAGVPVPVTCHGLSSLPEPVPLRITLLVDFQQLQFTLDG